jgi:hypothetical protein
MLALAVVLVTGCSTLPTTGAVHTEPGSASDPGQAPYFAPPGPIKGADRESIVRGFLLATQANPPSTAVARSFLSEGARNTWKPTGTMVYDGATLEPTAYGVRARLSEAHALDQRGAWVGGATPSTVTYPYSLVLDHDEWRIANPPTALPVPTPYFSSLYQPYLLYFFDRTGTVLVPSRVYLPIGEQTATNLVRGLLAGPGPATAESTVTAFAPRTGLDLSVVVSDDGVAEVPLGPEIQRLSPADLYRAVVQLAWTLRQVPGVTRLRITVGGAAVPLYNGQTDVSVNVGSDYDPIAAPGRDILTLTGGKLIRGVGALAKPVGGPFGVTGFALRSVAQSVSKHEYAAVSTNGHRLFVAADGGSTSAAKVTTVLDGSTDLLRPAFDRFGGLWALDDTKGGAVVHLITNGHDQVVHVPGISGHRVNAFTVTRDGASLVAGLASGPSPTLVVSALLRSEGGRLLQALAGRQTVVEASDHGPVVDLSQSSATTVAVLTGSTAGNGQIISVELDGSPGASPATSPDPLPGELVSLAASPDPSLPLRVVTSDGKLMELTGADSWIRIASNVTAAAYAQ